jgi:hypothetical protein
MPSIDDYLMEKVDFGRRRAEKNRKFTPPRILELYFDSRAADPGQKCVTVAKPLAAGIKTARFKP